MEKIIDATVEHVDRNSCPGELHIKIKPVGYKKSFYVFFEGERRYSIQKNDTITIKLYSLMPLKKSKSKVKKIIVEKNQNHVVDYNGLIIKELENHFLVDATLPILVDKEPGFKIGDYITVGFNHTIQAYLVKDENPD